MSVFVLLHGGFHGPWCWDRLTPLLAARDHRVLAPSLVERGGDGLPAPGSTPARAIEQITQVVQAQSLPVVLVGHSAAGPIISAIAETIPHRIRALVFVSAILPRIGPPEAESFVQTYDAPLPPMDATADGAAYFFTDRQVARQVFYNCCPDEDTEAALARLAPDPLVAPPAITLTPGRFGSVRRAYVECLRDNILPIRAARGMQRAAPCDPVYTLDTDHSPMLSRPDELAAALDEIARL